MEAISQTVSNCTVASLARCTKGDIDAAWNAVKGAKHPRIHVFLATSDIHMEYKLKMTREQVVDSISQMVSYAKSYCDDIEFSAEDASRSEWSFLAKCYSTAVAAGATTLNVPDTVGYSTPEEMFNLISYLKAMWRAWKTWISPSTATTTWAWLWPTPWPVSGRAPLRWSAPSTASASGPATPVWRKWSWPFIPGWTSTVRRPASIPARSTSPASCSPASPGVPISPSKAIVGANAFAHESGIHQHGVIANAQTYEIMRSTDVGIPQNTMVLGKHSGKHALRERLESMGYTISDSQLEEIFVRFKVPGGQEEVHHQLRSGGPGPQPPPG